ncbi:phage holin [Niallia sp.]|uniref:phage holin n=1 Tax=Niallia sp. TaxID=2837523 RepID=UPI00289AB93F|nr:phage holin [Niallia sp.]
MDKASVTRFALLILAVINSVLNMLGYQTISEDLVNDIIAVASGIYILYAGWKNNYLSKKGLKQKEVLKENNLTNAK